MRNRGLVVLGIGISMTGALVWSEAAPAAPLPAAASDTASRAGVVAPGIEEAPRPATSRVSVDGDWWTRSLSERTDEPLAVSDEDSLAATLTGRVSVRQRPGLHPAKITIRLTRSWLDTVVPVEAGTKDQRAPQVDEVVAVTDSEGRFTLRFAPTTGELFFLIDEHGPWMDFQKVSCVPRAAEHRDLGDLWLDARGGIAGIVVDAMGQPIPEATVRAVDDPLQDVGSGLDELRAARNRGIELFRVPGSLANGPVPDWVVRRDGYLPFPTATTDKTGRFQLSGLRPGPHHLFAMTTTGSARIDDAQVGPDRITEVGRIVLDENPSLDFEFQDERGKPWAGAEVAFIDDRIGFGSRAQFTNSRGEVRASVPSFEHTAITFAYPGGGPWVQIRQWQYRPLIQVPRPAEGTVVLCDELGHPIANGQVRFYASGRAFRPVDRALPSGMQPTEVAPGRYRGKVPCPVVAVAAAPGFAPAMTAIDGTGAEVVMTMLPIRSITVRTVDRHGVVVPNAAVRIQAHTNPELRFPGAQWDLLANDRVLVGHTDATGLLRVPVWDTFLSLQAEHPRFGPSPGPKVKPIPGQTIDLMLRRQARVNGRLSFQQRPASAGFRIRARQKPPAGHELEGSGWLDEQLAVTDANGVFAFRGLNAGVWELQPELPRLPSPDGATEPGSHWQAVRVVLDEDQELYCNLEAEENPLSLRSVIGTIRRDGAPVAEALVRVRRTTTTATPGEIEAKFALLAEGRGRDPASPIKPWSRRLTTDSFGDFLFGDLEPDADYELRIDVPFQDRLQFLEQRVVHTPLRSTDPPTQVDVDFQSCSAQLVCENGGRTFGNRVLRLRRVAEDGSELSRFDVLTSPTGIAECSGLPTGNWSIAPAHGGYCRPARLELKPGGSVTAQVAILGLR